MKIKGWRLKNRTKFTHNRFHWCCFLNVYKGLHLVLLIIRCLGISYKVDVILRAVTSAT